MRLFFAIELPDTVRAQLARLRDQLKSKIDKASFTRDENLHITLKFLGEMDERKVDELTESIAKIRSAPIELRAEAIECFPQRGAVRIVAAGFGGDLPTLNAMHRTVEQRCQHLGVSPEQRPYRPHVTLARARSTLPGSTRALANKITTGLLPADGFSVDRFVLMQSRLTPSGSHYSVLKTFLFTEKDDPP
jgi:2'-5' RNA ligase